MYYLPQSLRSVDSSGLRAVMKKGRRLLAVALTSLVAVGLLCFIASRGPGKRVALQEGASAVDSAGRATQASAESKQTSMATGQIAEQAGGSRVDSELSSGSERSASSQVAEAYNQLPLSFEVNEGQADARVRFYSRGHGYELFLTPTEAVLALRSPAPQQKKKDAKTQKRESALPKAESESAGRMERITGEARPVSQTAVLKMELKGANRSPSMSGLDELPGKVNYLIGRRPENWRTGVKTYARVRYESVYPGIDLVYYGKQRELEYDFIVAPGADARAMRLAFRGTLRPIVNEQGELVLRPTEGGGGDVRFRKPTVYQETAGVRREVASRYVFRKGGEVGFEVGEYDHQKPLVIDPALSYSTYGGNGFPDASSIAVDNEGNAYVTGPALLSGHDSFDAFVLKLNASGSAALYLTYLGGGMDDVGYSIAVDAGGSAYVAGRTNSPDFPSVNALQPSIHGLYDGFVARLSPSGSQLLYSTFLGGSTSDTIRGLALDANGNAYLAGYTSSADFPTSNPFQSSKRTTAVSKTTDGGDNWSPSALGINADVIYHLAIDPSTPSTLYAATSNGVFKSTNSGGNWTSVGQNQLPLIVSHLAINPVNTSTLYAGTSMGVYKSTDGGNNWTSSGLSNIYYITGLVIDPANPSILYATGDHPAVYKSVDAGNSWTQLSNGINSDTIFISLVIDPTNPSIIYAGTRQDSVYKSTNGGNNWTRLPDFEPNIYTAYDLAIDKNSPSTLYAATGKSIYKSTNGGNNWTLVMTGSSFSVVAVDPANSSTIYAGIYGYSGAIYGYSGGMYRSRNAGLSWQPINTGLTRNSIRSIVIDPVNTSTVYIGSSTDTEGFVAKLNPAGNGLVYSTFLGGNDYDYVNGIAVDGSGDAVVAGVTLSTNFPTANAIQSTSNGNAEAFVTKLNPSGTALLYSTYLGGSSDDEADCIALDSSGNAYVAGDTFSSNFPTANAFQPAKDDWNHRDAFVTKINANGSALIYSTYLGGNMEDYAWGIAVDAVGNAYITGPTASRNFPILGGFQTQLVNPHSAAAFLTKLNAAGALAYSTYFGGSDDDGGHAVAVDSAGNIYLAGWANSRNFPTTPGALYPTFGGRQEAFIAKFSPAIDLALTMTGSPSSVSYGDSLPYTLKVTNQGELPATGVTINDSLPQGATLVSATASQGSCSGTGPVICSLGNLSAGSSATVTIAIKPPASKSITNTATVTRNEPEQDQSNNSATVSTQVIFADLSVTKSAASDSVAPGSKITYFITVSNSLGSTTGPVTLTDNLPAEVTFISCSAGAGGVCGGSGNNRSVTFPSLAEGASAMTVIVATVNNSVATGTVINNTASASAALPDPTSSNNSALSAVTITGAPIKLRQSGKIATVSDRAFTNSTQPSGIYVINPDGTGESLLKVGAGGSAPAWSPDGTRIAYGDNVDSSQNRSRLYVARADGTSPILVATDTFDRNTRAAWSPNGRKLAYVASDFAIHLANADGTGSVKLPNSPTFINDLSWSPDGTMFAYSDGTDIFKMNADGTGQTNLTQGRPVNNGEVTRSAVPRWSPDGTRLLFQGSSNNYRITYVMNADGSGLAQVFSGTYDSQDPAWSPDGTKITYISLNSLFVANADGTHRTQVTNNGFYNSKPDWQALLALPSLQFSAATYSASEGAGIATINVTRSGDASTALTVDYATSDGTAKQRTDYTLANGTLSFAPGETSKSFNILLTDNAYVDGQRTVNLSLGNPLDAGLAQPSTAVLTITDNDMSPPAANPIDDAQFFVRQQYADFLNRQPDAGGLGYWTGQITNCGSDAHCIHDRRVGVADAFYFETEFQQTGGYIYRVYKAALGTRPTYAQFTSDRGRVVVGPGLDQSKSAFALVFAQRDSFLTLYPRTQTASQFVDALLLNIKQNSGVDLTSQRASLISLADGTDTGRAAILKQLAESQSFIDAEYNRSFVLMEYFGYLRRDPDQGGFDFWLNQVNKYPLRNVSIQHAMACSFITSAEYQTRFSSVVTHTNQECPQ